MALLKKRFKSSWVRFPVYRAYRYCSFRFSYVVWDTIQYALRDALPQLIHFDPTVVK